VEFFSRVRGLCLPFLYKIVLPETVAILCVRGVTMVSPDCQLSITGYYRHLKEQRLMDLHYDWEIVLRVSNKKIIGWRHI